MKKTQDPHTAVRLFFFVTQGTLDLPSIIHHNFHGNNTAKKSKEPKTLQDGSLGSEIEERLEQQKIAEAHGFLHTNMIIISES